MEGIEDIESGKKYLYENYLNIEEEVVNPLNKECYIFFSSNGLYGESSFQEFEASMLKKDRYEWKSIVSSLKKRKGIGKIIYVRDIYKNFYIEGASSRLSSIDKILKYLGNCVKGFNVTTAGISSGGYMAVVAGCILRARRIFCISGQFDLSNRLTESDARRFKYNNPEYFNIVELIKENNVPVYYFCPVNCPHDYDSYTRVKDIKTVRCFLFPDKVHAATVYPFNFPDLLYLTNERLDKLQGYYDGKLINKNEFLLRTISVAGMIEFVRRFWKSRLNVKHLKDLWDVKGSR